MELKTDDYPDWMNPMLVKESRQAMDSGLFKVLWVGLPLGLCFFVCMGLLSSLSGEWSPTGLLAFTYYIVFCFILPLHSAGIIKSELVPANHELLAVSPMGTAEVTKGIVRGVLLRTMLFACMLLPLGAVFYFVARVSPFAFIYELITFMTVSVAISLIFMFAATMGSTLVSLLVGGALLGGYGFFLGFVSTVSMAFASFDGFAVKSGVVIGSLLTILVMRGALDTKVAGPYNAYGVAAANMKVRQKALVERKKMDEKEAPRP